MSTEGDKCYNAFMEIRRYDRTYLKEIAELFYHTVHTINAEDYTPVQLDAWADGKPDLYLWDRSLTENYSIIAVEHGIVTGFGDISHTGYLDRLYVHRERQRQGIATALCMELEKHAGEASVTVHASITAKTFFLKRGYRVLAKQQVTRGDILLTNYIMEKQNG